MPDRAVSEQAVSESAAPGLRVAVLGLGRIGLPVLTNLARAGGDVRGFDVRAELRTQVEAAGAGWAATPDDAVAAADVIITVLPGSPELRALMLGGNGDRGLVDRLPPGSTWVDLTSASPELGAELAEAARAHATGYLDAPVGGGIAAAQAGTLTLYVGGDGALLDRVRPLLESVAGTVHHLGGPGSGYLAKLLVNLLWFGQAIATGEAFLLARSAGLDLDQLREVLLDGPAATDFLRVHLPAALAGDYLPSFGLDRCVEELDSIERLGRARGLPVDLTAVVAGLHRDALARYGPVDGELLGIAGLEQRAGMRLGSPRPGHPDGETT